MSETSDARQHATGAAGSRAPHVPYLTPGLERVDAGPAGSLVQARARERQLRSTRRPPLLRDARLWQSMGLAVLVLVLALVAVGARTLLGAALCALLTLGVAGVALLVLLRRWRAEPVERQLTEQIAQECGSAAALETLCGRGWSVFHDRLVPGTEHRVPHVIAGPGGVLVVGALPVRASLQVRPGAGELVAGGISLDPWFRARWWEAEQLNADLARRLSGWPWQGPMYAIALLPRPSSRWRRRSAEQEQRGGLPTDYAGVPIVTVAGLLGWVDFLPRPLGSLATSELVAAVEEACAPAALRS